MGEMLEVAKKAAIGAGKITISLRAKKHKYFIKIAEDEIGDFTTEADKLAEQKILEILQSRFPKHNYLSEEAGRQDSGSDYWWVIDPLDGTWAYSHGLPSFGVSIGLLKEGKPILGVLNFPAFNCIYWSEEGNGAYMNGKRIKVTDEKDLSKCFVGFGLGYVGERDEEIEKLLKPIAGVVRYPPVVEAAILGLSYVARGAYAGYVQWAYPWDFVGGAAIIEEAGGKLTDFWG
ncbi:hypothetical protein A2865_01550, partial [Candidatus Woesebacteria bacterium RIFCSPHIGHO2_01_FULL_39_17]